jgi:hypothetical protein
VLGNKRALELHQELMKLLEWLAGDEHGREELAPSGGGHGGRWHAEGEQEDLFMLLRVTRVT